MIEKALGCSNRRAEDASSKISSRQFSSMYRYIPPGADSIERVFG